MKIKELIEIMESVLRVANYSDDMQGMDGEWYWEDSYMIERDLGCSIRLYDWAKEKLYFLKKLDTIGKEEVCLCIEDMYYCEEAKQLVKDK